MEQPRTTIQSPSSPQDIISTTTNVPTIPLHPMAINVSEQLQVLGILNIVLCKWFQKLIISWTKNYNTMIYKLHAYNVICFFFRVCCIYIEHFTQFLKRLIAQNTLFIHNLTSITRLKHPSGRIHWQHSRSWRWICSAPHHPTVN